MLAQLQGMVLQQEDQVQRRKLPTRHWKKQLALDKLAV
jgi:hypothetical protein